MLENAPLEPFSCSIPYRHVMKFLIEKRHVLNKAVLLPLKIYFSTSYLNTAISKIICVVLLRRTFYILFIKYIVFEGNS